MVGSKRDLPSGDEVSWAKYSGVLQHVLYSPCRAVLPCIALSPQIWDILAVCRHGSYNEHIYIFSLARDEASSDRGDTFSVAGALVLEKVLPSRRKTWAYRSLNVENIFYIEPIYLSTYFFTRTFSSIYFQLQIRNSVIEIVFVDLHPDRMFIINKGEEG